MQSLSKRVPHYALGLLFCLTLTSNLFVERANENEICHERIKSVRGMLIFLSSLNFAIPLTPDSTNVLSDPATFKVKWFALGLVVMKKNTLKTDCLGSWVYSCSFIIDGPDRHLVRRSLIFFSDLGFGVDQADNLMIIYAILSMQSISTVQVMLFPRHTTDIMQCFPHWRKAEIHLAEKKKHSMVWE